MCGICGIGFGDRQLIKKINNALVHRGPDSQGYFVDNNVSLGIRRLKIIDLETGDQPIYNEDKTVVTVYNGEIYNFKELKYRLEKAKHRFYTNTDTEVIVHLYEEYGDEFPRYLDGMFAVALYDSKKKKILLARDRLGIKPLYYTSENDFYFASELKALLQNKEIKKEIDKQAFHNYLSFGYIPGPLSIIKSIKKLSPGHILIYSKGKRVIKQFWDLKYSEQINRSESQTKKELLSELQKAVDSHLISDVPLGAFLSGGIDSSTIVAMMSKAMKEPVKTFSIGFPEDDYNELKYARIVAEHFNTDHKEFVVTPDLLNVIGEIVWHLDEPYSDPSAFPVYYVSQMARKYVTVALSGEGGDEIFAGYPRYFQWKQDKLIEYYKRLPSGIKSIGKKVATMSGDDTKRKIDKIDKLSVMEDPEYWYNSKITLFTEEEKSKLYKPKNADDSYKIVYNYYKNNNALSKLNKELYVDVKTYLVDNNLCKVDRMSMLHSLEIRVPFLDNNFIKFVSSLPTEMKVRDNMGKYLLRQAVKDILPKQILERKKMGFALPLKYWLKKELYSSASLILDKSETFNKDYVNKILGQHKSNNRNNDRRIWTLISYELWNRIYIDGLSYKKIKI